MNTLILTASLICVWGVRRISIIANKEIEDADRKISINETLLLEQVLILVLGVLSIYIFAVKGIYGLYKSFGNLSFISILLGWGLLFHLTILYQQRVKYKVY